MMKLFKVSKYLAGQGKNTQSSLFVLLYVRFCLLLDLHFFVLWKVRKCRFFFFSLKKDSNLINSIFQSYVHLVV